MRCCAVIGLSVAAMATGGAVLRADDAPADAKAAAPGVVDYVRDVKPILAEHCYKCHGPEKQKHQLRLDQRAYALRGGDSGDPAIKPGEPDASAIIGRVTHADPEQRMPRNGEPLTAEQIATLRAWIAAGAPMPGDDTADLRITTDHWSFQPIADPSPPAVAAPTANPIDAFVIAKLNEKGLSLSPEADRRTLIRRVYLVMLGLLPTSDEVDAFVNDAASDAYAKLIERVLASPRYGERWGQHWLDLVRYGDTNGFETNTPRPNAWPYRDWVIASLNADKPYDRFLFEQLAGDSVGADVATGYLVAGPYDQVKSPDVNLTEMQRQDELHDIVSTTGAAMLGITVGCARCHNHKFDPVTQTDYYAMQSVFAGVNHGDRQLTNATDTKRAAELADRIDTLRNQLRPYLPRAYPGRVIVIDDEDPAPAVTLLAKKEGHGTNLPGKSRGQKDDPGDGSRLPNLSRGRYTWFDYKPGENLIAYRPGAAGGFHLWVSWGTGYATHVTDATYLLDADGDPATADDQRIVGQVNQQQFADGAIAEQLRTPLWSGLRYLGEFDLRAESAVILRGGGDKKANHANTADVIVLQEVIAGDNSPHDKPLLRNPVASTVNEERITPVLARSVRFRINTSNSGSEPCIDELEVYAVADAAGKSRNVALASAGAKASSSGNYAGNPKHKLEHLNDGRYGNDYSWISNTNNAGWVRIDLAEPTMIDRIVWGRDREQQFADRTAADYVIEVISGGADAAGEQWTPVAASLDRLPPGMNAPMSIAYSFFGHRAEVVAAARRQIDELRTLEAEQQNITATITAYAGVFKQPPITHRLYRGDPFSPREVVAPNGLSVLTDLKLAPDAAQHERRIAFANWVISPDNPLTARVMVNRIWQHHFGAGIVDTPSDFGGNGTPPTHPQLLDWLARRFIESGWSVKHVHRLILNSRAFRQAAAPNPDAMKVDRNARLLWRYPPRRLEAEPIRDCMLQVAGVLDLTAGGPGWSVFEPNSNYVRNYEPKTAWGPAEFRRMVFAQKIRMEGGPVFGAFDCPDAAQPQPLRTRSITAIQALNLFNSTFTMTVADKLAQRIKQDAGDDITAQINRAYQLTLGRDPTLAEFAIVKPLVDEHGLTALTRVLYNTNEFLFLP